MPQIKTLGKHPLVTALKWLLAAGAIWLVIQKVPLAGIGPALASARLGPLLGSLTAIFVSSILNAYRWRALLRAPDLGVTKYLYFIFVGHFFNLFMPSAVAAEAVKVVAFGKRYGNLQQNIGVTLVARGMGLLAQLGIGAIAFSLYFRELSRSGLYSRLNAPWLVLGLAIAAGVAAAAAVFAFRRGLAAQPWVQAIVAASRNRSLMVKTAGLTLGIQALSAISGYCLFLSVFPDAPFGKVLLFILIIQAILMIPFSLGGVGVREYLVYLFFSQLGGMPREAVLAANLLGYVPLILLSLTGGAWILFRRHGPMLSAFRAEAAARRASGGKPGE